MDDQSFSVVENQRTKPLFLLCEHASFHIPREYKDLGISKEDIHSHYGGDIGAFDVFQRMISQTETVGVYSNISRLLIDSNRIPDARDLIREELDPGQIIPGNYQISSQERKRRLERYWKPFHRAVEEEISAYLQEGLRPFLISIHSFTPEWRGEVRDLDIGLLYHPEIQESEVRSQAMRERLSQKGYVVELNQPYSVEDPRPYPIHHYAVDYDLSYVAIEVNNERINTRQKAYKIGNHLADILSEL